MRTVIDTVQLLTGRRPNTIREVRAELVSFLKSKDADDLIVDDDIQMLFELCAIYSDIPIERLVTNQVIKELYEPTLYKRVGPRLIPLQRETDKNIIDKLANVIIDLHPDLNYVMKQHGVAFIDEVNVVFSFEQLRSVENLPAEFSGSVVFPRIKTPADRDRLIPQTYLEDKRWVFKTLRNKYSRLEGRYFTTTELMDLISDRNIITHGNYR